MQPGISITSHQKQARSGITLMEILIVTVIIGLMAAISFPVFKIVQQREKERRLKKILYDVRAAISGSKSPQAITEFTEGYRTYIRVKGIGGIPPGAASSAVSVFIKNLGSEGLGYPPSPRALVSSGYTIRVATSTSDPTNDYVEIHVDRRLLRTIPPHPFKSWFPNAEWRFRPATDTAQAFASSTTDPWQTGTYYGVADMVSRGAGMALDGSSTDDW